MLFICATIFFYRTIHSHFFYEVLFIPLWYMCIAFSQLYNMTTCMWCYSTGSFILLSETTCLLLFISGQRSWQNFFWIVISKDRWKELLRNYRSKMLQVRPFFGNLQRVALHSCMVSSGTKKIHTSVDNKEWKRCRCHNSLYRNGIFWCDVQVVPKTKQYWLSISCPIVLPSPGTMFWTYDEALTWCLSRWGSIWSVTTSLVMLRLEMLVLHSIFCMNAWCSLCLPCTGAPRIIWVLNVDTIMMYSNLKLLLRDWLFVSCYSDGYFAMFYFLLFFTAGGKSVTAWDLEGISACCYMLHMTWPLFAVSSHFFSSTLSCKIRPKNEPRCSVHVLLFPIYTK
jgi:hypothetical protein